AFSADLRTSAEVPAVERGRGDDDAVHDDRKSLLEMFLCDGVKLLCALAIELKVDHIALVGVLRGKSPAYSGAVQFHGIAHQDVLFWSFLFLLFVFFLSSSFGSGGIFVLFVLQ